MSKHTNEAMRGLFGLLKEFRERPVYTQTTQPGGYVDYTPVIGRTLPNGLLWLEPTSKKWMSGEGFAGQLTRPHHLTYVWRQTMLKASIGGPTTHHTHEDAERLRVLFEDVCRVFYGGKSKLPEQLASADLDKLREQALWSSQYKGGKTYGTLHPVEDAAE